jgi:branched-chain amino acid transport system substrate-binding protein
MLVSTLAPADMTADTPYLIAPVEVHPIYNVTGVDWVARNWPDKKTLAIATQDDELGLSSLATYRAACEVAGIEIVDEKLFGFDVVDFAPVVSALLAKNPDILCWDTAYPDYVTLMTEQAFLQGFKGKFVSCTLDQYPNVIDKTSQEFVEGFIFQFPDFDDPIMQGPDINFANAAEFYRIYNEKYPGAWNAVSWEYAGILESWKLGVELAGSYEPLDVLAALKGMETFPHVFGPAKWWGKDFFGVDNAPIGRWPVVQMQNGKAVIVEMADVMAWLEQHQDVLYRHFKDLNMV